VQKGNLIKKGLGKHSNSQHAQTCYNIYNTQSHEGVETGWRMVHIVGTVQRESKLTAPTNLRATSLQWWNRPGTLKVEINSAVVEWSSILTSVLYDAQTTPTETKNHRQKSKHKTAEK